MSMHQLPSGPSAFTYLFGGLCGGQDARARIEGLAAPAGAAAAAGAAPGRRHRRAAPARLPLDRRATTPSNPGFG